MRYMEHTVAGFDAGAAADRGLDLVGTWYTMGSTGRWPQVVNLWECVDGWSGWRRLMERTNLRRTRNPELNEWWRTGARGAHRRLRPPAGCGARLSRRSPTCRRDGVSGSVFVHELSQVRPGAALDYLAAVRDEWQPVLADYGHALVGLYEVLLTDVEVVTIWATDPAGARATRQAPWTRATTTASRAGARAPATTSPHWREELMTPHPDTLLSRGDSL